MPINKVLLESSHFHLFMFSHDTSRVEHLQEKPYGFPSIHLLYGPFQTVCPILNNTTAKVVLLKYVPETGLFLVTFYFVIIGTYFSFLFNNYCPKSLHGDCIIWAQPTSPAMAQMFQYLLLNALFFFFECTIVFKPALPAICTP